MNLIEIKSDALGVVKRIKSLNKKYLVFYNLKKNKFELYLTQTNLKPNLYCLTFSENELVPSMIETVLKSEIQNRKLILDEIEKHNALMLAREQKKILENMECELESKRNS